MGSNEKQDDPKVTRAREREWVVVLLTNGRGRPSHQTGRLTLAEAEQQAEEMRARSAAAGTRDTIDVAHRPPRAHKYSKARRYYCRRCKVEVEALPPAPRSCVGCGLNQYLLAVRAADKAVA